MTQILNRMRCWRKKKVKEHPEKLPLSPKAGKTRSRVSYRHFRNSEDASMCKKAASRPNGNGDPGISEQRHEKE